MVGFLRAKAMGLAFSTSIVFALLQFILPAMFDFIVTFIIIGIFWVATKLKL